MKEKLFYFGFETKERRPIAQLPEGIMTDAKYYLLVKVSPNVLGAGIYREVSMNEFISRNREAE